KKGEGAGKAQSGAGGGTPAYRAREKAGGRAVGPLADVYALGAALYECLTGRPPFKAATQLDTIMQLVSDEPVPPARLQPKTPRDLETICLKCLHKDSNKRYPSAKALAEDLGRWLEGLTILARPVRAPERLWRWCRRNPAVATLLAAVACSLVAGTAVSALFAVEASRQAREARDNAGQANAAKERANTEKDRANA